MAVFTFYRSFLTSQINDNKTSPSAGAVCLPPLLPSLPVVLKQMFVLYRCCLKSLIMVIENYKLFFFFFKKNIRENSFLQAQCAFLTLPLTFFFC